jgi:hypothetical protein
LGKRAATDSKMRTTVQRVIAIMVMVFLVSCTATINDSMRKHVKVGSTTKEQLYRLMGTPDRSCNGGASAPMVTDCLAYTLPNCRIAIFQLENNVVVRSAVIDDGLSRMQHEQRSAMAGAVAAGILIGAAKVAEDAVDAEAAAAQRRAGRLSFTDPGAVESYITGEFHGWAGDTIFQLDNGQIWQQVGYSYLYHYAYHPKAIINEDGGVYRLRVEGLDASIPVKRLR